MKHSVITENDISAWKDKTGELYHFPSRYKKFLEEGTKLIYYKGRIKDKKFNDFRLSPDPHYFGIASIKRIFPDKESYKNDYYAEISGFIPFSKPVLAKNGNEYLEKIPESRKGNYWRDAVRPITEEIYNLVISKSDLSSINESNLNDLNQGLNLSFESEISEGKKKLRFTSF